MPHVSDLTDTEWALVEPLLADAARRRSTAAEAADERAVLDAVLYVLHAQCPWPELPPSYPACKTVAGRFEEWRRDGTWGKVYCLLHLNWCATRGREAAEAPRS